MKYMVDASLCSKIQILTVTVLVIDSIAMIKHHGQKQFDGEMLFFSYSSISQFIKIGTQTGPKSAGRS